MHSGYAVRAPVQNLAVDFQKTTDWKRAASNLVY
jgi:hypothetical protein